MMLSPECLLSSHNCGIGTCNLEFNVYSGYAWVAKPAIPSLTATQTCDSGSQLAAFQVSLFSLTT